MTPNKEDYLKELCKLGERDGMIGNKKLAEILKISPASVSEMLSKLSKEGLIEYEPYKGSRLTAQGYEKAVLLLRSHRLWEVFLVEQLGYSWSEVHEDANRLEHVTSAKLAERLDTYLQRPDHCPHGATIPREGSTARLPELTTLNLLRPGDETVVRRVVEETELLEYLGSLGVKIGMPIQLMEAAAYEGPLTLSLDGRRVQMSYKAACQIYVDKIS